MSIGVLGKNDLENELIYSGFRDLRSPQLARSRKPSTSTYYLLKLWNGENIVTDLHGKFVAKIDLEPQTTSASLDLQSGLITRSKIACEQAAYAIRSAHQHLSPEDALMTIGTIWESLEKTGQLAEARTRFCLHKLQEPQLADSPAWLAEQLEVLSQPDEDLAPSHPLAIEAADRLIRACIQSSKTATKAGVQKVPLGNVLVDWDVEPHSLQWEVEAARLPWPGVKVNAMVVDNSGDKPQTHTRIFHTAFEVIEHFNEQLHAFGIQEGLR